VNFFMQFELDGTPPLRVLRGFKPCTDLLLNPSYLFCFSVIIDRTVFRLMDTWTNTGISGNLFGELIADFFFVENNLLRCKNIF